MSTRKAVPSVLTWRLAGRVAVAIGGLAVIVSLGLYLVLVVSLGFPGHYPMVGDAEATVRSYYAAIQRQDYPAAYSHLDPHATLTVNGQPRAIDSVDTLASAARAADRDSGAITAYTPADGQFQRGTKIVDMT